MRERRKWRRGSKMTRAVRRHRLWRVTYNDANPARLPFRYNRAAGQSSQEAKSLYGAAITDAHKAISEALDAATEESCDRALKELGKLSHMFQDYYGHANPLFSETHYPAWGQWIGVPEVKVLIIGCPENPLMAPSSFGGAMKSSQHGSIWEKEPGRRSSMYKTHYQQAVLVTKKLFKNYLSLWCDRCSKCPPKRSNFWNRFPL